MPLSIANITFDCEEPQRVATFWAAALGLEIDNGSNEFSEFFVSIGIGRDDVAPNWLFIKVPEDKLAKNRVHFDLEAEDAAVEVDRLVSLGASHVADMVEHGHEWSVMNDVEGNEFCVSGPPA